MTAPRLPKLIRVIRRHGAMTVEIDGEEFPWLTVGGAGLTVEKGMAPAVHLVVPAERIEVIDDVRPRVKQQ